MITKLLDIINSFKDKKILVIGDAILDSYTYSNAVGLSLETPTLLCEEEKTNIIFGGTGNVVMNILALGAKVTFLTLLGDDEDARYYLDYKNISLDIIPIIEPKRKTTVKKRFYIKKNNISYKHLEVHKMDTYELNEISEEKVLKFLKEQIKNFDAVLLVDYHGGLMKKSLIEKIKKIIKENKVFSFASSQVFKTGANHMDYSGVDVIVLNLKEAEAVMPNFSLAKINELSDLLSSGVCITLGKNGSILYMDKKLCKSDAIDVKEIDSCGAGDSFIAAFALAEPNKNPEESLLLGNIWAGLSVQEIGTTVPDINNLLKFIKNND